MFKAKVISGDVFTYKSKKDNSDRQGFTMWYCFDGCPFSFRSSFFSESDISKAKAAVQTGTCEFILQPNNNIEPTFKLK